MSDKEGGFTPNLTQTGIGKLDEILNGGLPKSRVYVISGECGTGKTIFGLQYIFNGASSFDEPGVYVNLEQDRSKIIEDARNFGWDLESLEQKGKLRIISFVEDVEKDLEQSLNGKGANEEQKEFLMASALFNKIKEAAEEIGATRVVVDPWTAITVFSTSEALSRQITLIFFSWLRSLNATSIITVEADMGHWKQIYFISSGVIELDHVVSGDNVYRGLTVKKLRGKDYKDGFFNFNITSSGIDVLANL